MKRFPLSLVFPIAYVSSVVVVNGSVIKHAKHLHHNDGQMHGWAVRLNVDADAHAFDRQLEQQQRQHYNHGTPLLSTVTTTTWWLWRAWQWLFSASATPPAGLTTTLWNDTMPRFVAYGDSYVANNSFGVPDPTALVGFSYYNIAFWVSTAGDDGNGGATDNVDEWTRASAKQRKAIVKAYNDAGIRLGIALFGAEDTPQSNGNDPYDLASRIATFVKAYNLQGVDVDYEEYDLFDELEATKWIIPLTRGLRSALPADQYYLSHAPTAPLYNTDMYPLGYTWVEQDIGSLIDWYNVQFYNQDDYATCDSLVHTANGFAPNTALLQIANVYKIPLSKIVVGKPAHKADAKDGYMSPSVLATCLALHAAPAGWSGGCMWWEYRGNLTRNILPIKKALKW